MMQMIVLSGGIAEAGETFIQQVRAAYLKYTWTKFPNPVRRSQYEAWTRCGSNRVA